MSVFGSIMSAIFGHGSAQASTSPTTPPTAPPAQTVDVAAIVDKAAAATGEKLAWRTSIVDLMKALNLDSSQHANNSTELKYTGNTTTRRIDIASTNRYATCRQWENAVSKANQARGTTLRAAGCRDR
jgi:hypothetical protein